MAYGTGSCDKNDILHHRKEYTNGQEAPLLISILAISCIVIL